MIVSGELVFDHDHAGRDGMPFDVDPHADGTAVRMGIAVDAARTPKQVFETYSSLPDEYAFARTVVAVRLARLGEENLVSRSQAKRLLQRVDRFRSVVLDFDGIASIGQSFADEIFRVFACDHPDIELIATRVQPDVQMMIPRAETLCVEDRNPLPLP